MSDDVILKISNVAKLYERGGQSVGVLNAINLNVPRGDYVALMGPSGSGKTTLLNIIGGLDGPTSGSVIVEGTDIATLDDRGLASWRTATIGFVFQRYNLIPVLTAFENVELPLLLFRMRKENRRRRAIAALDLVGLAGRAHHLPRQMSGGEEQRTSIARALVTDPKLIIADEPTGNLDAAAAANVLDLLERLNQDLRRTILMVTHDPAAGRRARRLARLLQGRPKLDREPGRGGMKFLPLMLKNIMRNRRRTALMAAGVAVAIFVISALLTVESGFGALTGSAQNNLLDVRERGLACIVTGRVFDSYLDSIKRRPEGRWLVHGARINVMTATIRFAVTPSVAAMGIPLSVVVGLLGGLPPALRAARLGVAEALKHS